MATATPLRSMILFLFLAMAGGILSPAVSLSGDASLPRLAILAPRDGAAVKAGHVLVIGKATGKGISKVSVEVNGKTVKTAVVVGGGFSVSVDLAPGRNVIRAIAGGTSATATVSAAAAGSRQDKGAYVYHAGVEKCAECHRSGDKGYVVARPRDALCYRCHARMDRKKLVHGPMGTGDCTACHDPHGSSHKALTAARHEALCLGCHDQKSSEAHFRKSKGKACTACHDPHSSDRPFLQK
jgi:predicted CXXCH cytochrome family protein